MKPLFVAFEGIDGSGKTYQVNAVKKALHKKDVPAVSFFAPSDRRWGKVAREIISGKRQCSPKEELDAFIEDLADISINHITPFLTEGCTVLIDRYVFSTWAYQGLKHEDIDVIIKTVMECLCVPDLVCVMDIPIKVAVERLQERGGGKDMYETKELLSLVQKSYHKLIHQEQDEIKNHTGRLFPGIKFLGFDAEYPKERVTDYIIEEIERRM